MGITGTGLSVLILVDDANMQGAARTVRRTVDYLALRDHLADRQEGRLLVEMVLYIGLPPDNENLRERRQRKLAFGRWAEHQGFMVVTKEGTPITVGDGNPSYKANVDVLMAIDAMDLALSIRPDVVVLVTGDRDFAHLAGQLRRRGIRVEIASTPQAGAEGLRRSANAFIDLTEVIGTFRALGGEPEVAIGGIDIFDSN